MGSLDSTNNKHKILLIDEDRFLNEVYSAKLTAAGFDVAFTLNGVEGLEKAKSFLPDLIILDLLLPKMSGNQLLEKLRQNKETKDTKVIVFTNVIPNEGIEKVAQYGITDYILKSDMSSVNLVDKVSHILQQ